MKHRTPIVKRLKAGPCFFHMQDTNYMYIHTIRIFTFLEDTIPQIEEILRSFFSRQQYRNSTHKQNAANNR